MSDMRCTGLQVYTLQVYACLLGCGVGGAQVRQLWAVAALPSAAADACPGNVRPCYLIGIQFLLRPRWHCSS